MKEIEPWDQQLNLARIGDPAALELVLRASRQNLRRYAEYHCEVNDMEDAVQESLFTVSRRIGDLRAVEGFASWLFRIVKRECNRLKRMMRRVSFEPIGEEIAGPNYPERNRILHDVACALESLPEHYRKIILLRDVEGRTMLELSKELNISVPACKARLHRARSLAREYLIA